MQQPVKAMSNKRNLKNMLTVSEPVEFKSKTLSNDSKSPAVSSKNTEKYIKPKARKRNNRELSEPVMPQFPTESNTDRIHRTVMREQSGNKVIKDIDESPIKRPKRSRDEIKPPETIIQSVKYDEIRTSPLKVIHEDQVEIEKAEDDPDGSPKKRKSKMKNKGSNPLGLQNESKADSKNAIPSKADVNEKYPVLKNEELIQKFLKVSMTNNQKGRIRQMLKDVFKGTSSVVLPDILHNRITAILKSSDNLTDTDLRKIRILYNMLKTAIDAEKSVEIIKPNSINKKKKETTNKSIEETRQKTPMEKQQLNKPKGPKRYVVFVGNLPVDINKEKILNHFSELKECVKDVRIPHRNAEKKSAIAYLELINEPTYELALSKHHSMLGSKRINVLYTTQQKTKISKADAKGKSAKLQAMLRSGQLLGSIPLKKKRSQRRANLKQARKAAETAQ